MRDDWDARAREDPHSYINWPEIPPEDWAFFASGRVDYNRYVRPFLTRVKFDPRGKTALEIGCGMGRLVRCLVEDFAQVIGADVSPEMIARARSFNLPRATFHAVSGAGLDGIAPGSVDLVVSFAVFQHVPDQQAITSYIRETARVLRPGGLFHLHMKGLATMRLGEFLLEAGFSLDPELLRLGLTKVPFLRVRRLDTWQGISIPPPQARQICASAGLRVLEVSSPWTVMMWVSGRKESDASVGGNE
jgi:SAM-dependent methyltransferase